MVEKDLAYMYLVAEPCRTRMDIVMIILKTRLVIEKK